MNSRLSSIAVFLCLFIVGLTRSELTTDKVHVRWRTWNDSITFHVTAETHGWVAIGFNDQAAMKGSDIVLAGFANNKGYIYDLHDPKGHTRPIADNQQDYKLVWAQENATHTFLVIRRPVDTGDKDDHKITDKSINLLWAYNDKDATSIKDFAYHGPQNRGAEELILLTPDVEIKFGAAHKNGTAHGKGKKTTAPPKKAQQ